MHLKILLVFFLQGLAFSLFAQFNYSKQTQAAHNAILNLDFQAYQLLKAKENTDEVAIYQWLNAYAEFASYLSGSNGNTIDTVVFNIQKNIKNDLFLSVVGVKNNPIDEHNMKMAAEFGGGRYVPVFNAEDAEKNLIYEIKKHAFLIK